MLAALTPAHFCTLCGGVRQRILAEWCVAPLQREGDNSCEEGETKCRATNSTKVDDHQRERGLSAHDEELPEGHMHTGLNASVKTVKVLSARGKKRTNSNSVAENGQIASPSQSTSADRDGSLMQPRP
jgi:hypothetical protein